MNEPAAKHDNPSVAERLATPVQFLAGVGPHRAELLAKLKLRTARDLLFYFPRDYQEIAPLCSIQELVAGRAASVAGVIEEAELRELGEGRCTFGILLRQPNGQPLRGVWFNQPHVAKQLRRGQQILLTGAPRRRGITWEMSHPQFELQEPEAPPPHEIQPVYSLTDGLRQGVMRNIIHRAVERFAEELEEVFPEEYRLAHDLAGIGQALRWVHGPRTRDELDRGRRRLVYQELLVLQLALALRRWQLRHDRPAPALPVNAKIDHRIRRLFPFEMTPDQQQAVAEVARDMGQTVPMNRLLQGDVGTGKTVVAMYALLLAAAHQRQAALMAPTEVLARQHVRTLSRSLQASRLRIGLLTGSLTPAQRRELLQQIGAGEIDLVVGTHAIANAIARQQVEFANLGLVIIDEQHKFGVRQRAFLRQAAEEPHCLVMTATPIPRTVSMTLFGDLDVSTLRNPPPGRQNVHTYLGDEATRQRWWDFVARKLREGRQGYVVAPIVDESQELASAEETFEALTNGPLEAFRLDLLHGRMSAEDKESAMQRFESGATQVLVATAVVEVGIDVPNATLMTVEGAERFGLAQLHQLRGRISRGSHPGYLCAFGNPQTEAAQQRLAAFQQTTDGFDLAELDFQLRGPGDMFGTRQHGLPPLRIADLQRDADLLEEARRNAQNLLEHDPGLADSGHQRLREMSIRRYGRSLDLSAS